MPASPSGGPDLSRLRLAPADREAPPRPQSPWRSAARAAGLVLAGAVVAWVARGAAPGEKPSGEKVTGTSSAAGGEKVTGTSSPVPVLAVPASTVMAGGRVESAGRRELSFGMPGLLKAVYVERGSVVKAGDLLAELEDAAERADVAQAQAGADAARARLDELKEGARPEELDQARRDAEAAQARAADAQEKFVQAQSLLQAGATTRTQVLEAQRAAEAEGARARSAQSRLALVERGARQTALATATAELGRARAQLAQAQARLALKRMVAPIDGTVVEVRSHAGEASGIEVPPPLVMTDLQHLEVKVDVPEAKATLVRPGQGATITVEALPERTFPGHVTGVSLEADRQKGTLEVTVAFDPGSGLELVRPRMAARAAIDVKARP